MLDTFGWDERTQSKKWVSLTLETVLYFVSLDKETTKWPLQMLETACVKERVLIGFRVCTIENIFVVVNFHIASSRMIFHFVSIK